MALIDHVRAVCNRLASAGWGDLFRQHGLDIEAQDLAAELRKPLAIDRNAPGFEDFAEEAIRAIEPGMPARSLLYHAFASPNVLTAGGTALQDFPTLAEIEAIENYIFGVEPPSIQELVALAGGNLMAIVVFATEYRPAVDTPLRKHADLCFSRTGIARVGTTGPHYDAAARGFLPIVPGDDDATIRVLPVRYSVWIAAQRKGNASTFGPMRFDDGQRTGSSDAQRDFWVPIQKLFSGKECIFGFDLEVDLAAHHVNEKIRRIHLELGRRGFDTGFSRPVIDEPPFRFSDAIAEISGAASLGRGVLVPVAHEPLVEAAKLPDGQPLTFRVPPSEGGFLPSFEISPPDPRFGRPGPEYVHVRHAPELAEPNLNERPDVAEFVGEGQYRAQHYIDFTGDGWIEPVCPQLASEFPRSIEAYSIVAAPDFYFNCDQRELMDWWQTRAPAALRNFLWDQPPLPLCDERHPPNVRLNNLDVHAGDASVPHADFRLEDETATAIVSIAARGQIQSRPLRDTRRNRHAALPDGAAGIFAPGWDTSHDSTDDVVHLAAYGLGSPFPEDSKLCAALSTFWPAVSPDAGRSFSTPFATVSPMTDEEIGSTGNLPWDGVRGPRVVFAGGREVVEYASFDHVDYVEMALANRFSIRLTSKVNTQAYTARVVAMARAYRAIGITSANAKPGVSVLSFRSVAGNDADVVAAAQETGVQLAGAIFRFELFTRQIVAQPADHRLRHVGINNARVVLVGGNREVLVRPRSAGPWRRVVVPN